LHGKKGIFDKKLEEEPGGIGIFSHISGSGMSVGQSGPEPGPEGKYF
jgi:hypothetical protein